MLITSLIPQISTLIPYSYSDIKKTEYEKLIQMMLSTAKPTNTPKLIHMLGIPGAGKTTFYHQHTWESHIFIGFDNIMEQLPGYQQDLHILGSVKAFGKWEIPARIIGYELLRRAISGRYNIFFDHGGANMCHLELIKKLKQLGYKTEIHYLKCSIKLASKRAILREKETGRHTPPQIINSRFSQLKTLAEEYQKLADKFYSYDDENTF